MLLISIFLATVGFVLFHKLPQLPLTNSTSLFTVGMLTLSFRRHTTHEAFAVVLSIIYVNAYVRRFMNENLLPIRMQRYKTWARHTGI